MPPLIDITGKRFGLLVAVKQLPRPSNSGVTPWLCKCDCGNTTRTPSTHLRRGWSKSCGCLCALINRYKKSTHGRAYSGEYTSWRGMVDRCTNSNNSKYRDYGGRGITVCDRWKSFDGFYEDMGIRPDGMSLDRIDVNGNYEPSNCRWATVAEQMRNMRTNVFVTVNGDRMTVAEASRLLGLSQSTIRARSRIDAEVSR